jgi:gas vesicle protein
MDAEITNVKENGKKNGSVGTIITVSIVGLAAGAALGLLFAPQTGKETRAMITSKAKELNENRKKALLKMARQAKELGESGKETADFVAHKVKTLASSKNS